MTLSQLYSRGTKLSEVDPDFRGMPLAKWGMVKIEEQAIAWYKRQLVSGVEPPINQKKILTPRDTYGIKGVLGR